MADEITVHVVDYGRSKLYMRYTDPITGKHVARSTGATTQKEAEKAAGKWEDELRSGRFKPRSRMTWEEFRDRYETEVASGLALETQKKIAAVFNVFEEQINPARLAVVTSALISAYVKKLRDLKRAETSIKSHLSHLKAALRWAHGQGLIGTVPTFNMPTRTKTARHRPPTGEEFDRMQAHAAKVVGAEQAESWKHLQRGLWLSGLRIGEAAVLSWDREEFPMVKRQGKYLMLQIPAKRQKNHKNELLPIAPEFARFLEETPEAERTGFVFNPRNLSGKRATLDWMKHTLAEIGRKANVKVDTEDDGTPQYATAHDFRRAFGDRWAKLVMPAVLKQLMRHASVQTTMAYYVGTDAEQTAALLERTAKGNTSSNTPTETAAEPEQKEATADVSESDAKADTAQCSTQSESQ